MASMALSLAEPKRFVAALAFVILWATGFVVAKFGIPYAPLWTILALRYFLAALMMMGLAIAGGADWPKGRLLFHMAITGLLLQVIYIGGAYAAIYAGIPAGITALIAGMQPILTACLAGSVLGEKTNGRQFLGIALGWIGLVLILWHKLHVSIDSPWGLLFALGALLGITCSTLYQKRFCPKVDLRSGAAIQYIAASVIYVPLMLILGIGEVHWQGEFLLALFWVVVVLSGGSIALLSWLLRDGAATSVASLFYVTPAIAAFFGYLWFGETLDSIAFSGMAMIIAGIYLVNRA